MIDSIRRTALACPFILLPLGCAAPPRTAVAPATRSACALQASGAAPPESVSVAASGPIVPTRVPTPGNSAERFVFAQLYETLINVDCEGHAYPGLAASWTVDETRTRLTLVIRDGARLWNGKPAVASDVVTAWRATGGQSTEPSRLALRVANGTTIIDDHTLTVSLPDTAWRLLADPTLAVYQPQSGTAWAEGTARYRVEVESSRGGLMLAPTWSVLDPRLSIEPLRTNDARDAIDRAIDVLVTDDPLAINYAAPRPDLTAVPLPWSRTYVLAVPRLGQSNAELLRPMIGDTAAAVRGSLARDAVRAEARAAEAPYWWSGLQSCELPARAPMPQPGSEDQPMRIAYDAREAVARRLAERLVALDHRAVAVPLGPDDFARALHDRTESAYVLALPRLSIDPCYDAAKLVASAPWLVPANGQGPQPAAPTVIPLVDTRDRAIVKRDRVSAMIDWDGTLRIGTPRAP